MVIIVICMLMEKKSLNLNLTMKMFQLFPTQFCLGSISNGFSALEKYL